MIKPSGSLFRRVLFWAHLTCGVTAGFLILFMSATGVLLTYERQILAAQAQANRVELPDGAVRLSADQLLERARAAAPEGVQLSLVFDADPAFPVTAVFGREQLLLNPVTGAVLPDAAAGTREFFRTITGWHRWLGGDSASPGARLIDLSNLLFVFIILSGIYLWLPPVWKWLGVRGRMLFRSSYMNGKARDYNWHHAFAFWMFIPLLLIAVSGVMMSYPWANKALFAAYGETPPQRGGPPGGAPANAAAMNRGASDGAADIAPAPRATAQQLLDAARDRISDWRRISLPASARGDSIDVSAELVSDNIRPPRQIVTLSTTDASVLRVSDPPAQTPGQRARSWIRFVHTGEEYGVIGQTIAGLASLAACFLVYTGFALAWRRLISPLYKRSNA